MSKSFVEYLEEQCEPKKEKEEKMSKDLKDRTLGHLSYFGDVNANISDEKETSDTTITFKDEWKDRYISIDTTSEIFFALANIVYYQGYEEDLISLKDKLKSHYEKNSEEHDSFCCPEHYQYDIQFHMYWMILVGCFGEWGVSIRSGWIWYENIPYAIRFIERLLEC